MRWLSHLVDEDPFAAPPDNAIKSAIDDVIDGDLYDLPDSVLDYEKLLGLKESRYKWLQDTHRSEDWRASWRDTVNSITTASKSETHITNSETDDESITDKDGRFVDLGRHVEGARNTSGMPLSVVELLERNMKSHHVIGRDKRKSKY